MSSQLTSWRQKPTINNVLLSVGEHENRIQNLPQTKSWEENITKLSKSVCGFMKVKGFLGSIWYQRICHPFRCVNVSCASGGTETSHSLCSPSKIISVEAATYCEGGSFYLQICSEPMTFPLPKSKAGQCFLLSEPTSLPLQPHELHHPVVVRENATTGDAELLP